MKYSQRADDYLIVVACLFCYAIGMENKKKTYEEIERITPHYLDSYDNDSFIMMLEEIAAIKGEQCIGLTIPIPTASK